MPTAVRSLVLVTGAASGIGFELAKGCAERGFDLVVAAGEPEIQLAAQAFRDLGAMVLAVQADLATPDGVEHLWSELKSCGQPIEMLLLNAGQGFAGPFLDQDFNLVRHAVDANLLSMLSLLQKVGGAMRQRGQGRILVAGAEAASSQPVQSGVQAFLDSFCLALSGELQGSGVTVLSMTADGSAESARQGLDALIGQGVEDEDGGWQGKLRAAFSQIRPPDNPESRPSH